ncbi:MAG: hypothetical protein R3C56_34945 [Pirellulaceae bacterium]
MSLDPVSAIEIVRDGAVTEKLKVDNSADFNGNLTVSFTKSGWFLVRAVTDVTDTFRFASSAPFYVEVGQDKASISIAKRDVLPGLDQ